MWFVVGVGWRGGASSALTVGSADGCSDLCDCGSVHGDGSPEMTCRLVGWALSSDWYSVWSVEGVWCSGTWSFDPVGSGILTVGAVLVEGDVAAKSAAIWGAGGCGHVLL